MSEHILSHDTIIARIRSAVFKEAGAWPTVVDARKVFDEMIRERDRTGVNLTVIAKQSFHDFHEKNFATGLARG